MNYVTVAEVDAYAASRGYADWTGPIEDKEAAIRRAEAWIDGAYRDRFPGTKLAGRDQVAEWPRLNAYDSEGNLVEGIPYEIQDATKEAAMREIKVPFSLTPDIVLGKEKVLTGVGSVKWEALGKGTIHDLMPTLTSVDQALSGLIGTKRNAIFNVTRA